MNPASPVRWPRFLTSVLVEELADSVVVTFGLGDAVPVESLEYFGYEVYYYGLDGNGGKRFGVRFSTTPETTAHVFDNASTTQANYVANHVTITTGSVVVRYPDADLGLKEVGTIRAFSHVNGGDNQTDFPVALMR